jgi:hypothetical protein
MGTSLGPDNAFTSESSGTGLPRIKFVHLEGIKASLTLWHSSIVVSTPRLLSENAHGRS